MTFRPEEIRRKVFLTTLRGYDRVEVEQYLRWIAEDYEDVLDELTELLDEQTAGSRARPRHAVVEAVDPLPLALVPLPAARPLHLRRSGRDFQVTASRPAPGPAVAEPDPAAAGAAGRAQLLERVREAFHAVETATAELATARELLGEISPSEQR